MADWVHCNKCFVQPTSSQTVKFYLTKCASIFCDACISLGKKNNCLICKNDCAIILLSSNLSPEVECYFSEPDNLLQTYMKVCEFQQGHRLKLNGHYLKELHNLKHKYSLMKEYIGKLSQKINTLEKDNSRLRNYIKASVASPANGPPPRTPLSNRSNLPNMGERSTGPQIINRPGSGSQWAPNYQQRSHSTQGSRNVPTDRVTENRLSLLRREYRGPQDDFLTPCPSYMNTSVVSGDSSRTLTRNLSFNMSCSSNLNQGRL